MKKAFAILSFVLLNLTLVVSCLTNGVSKNEIVSLDQAVKAASENITQKLGYSVLISSSANTTASTAEKAMQTGNMDIESIRQQAIKLNRKPKIAVLNFTSPSNKFSDYVIDELVSHLVKTNDFIVVERKELDLIWQENKFQMSGEISDESIVGIGKKLGAQFIVSGSLTSIGNIYHCRIKILDIETAQILLSPSWDISSRESQVVSLLAGAKPPHEGRQTTVAKVTTVKVYKIGDKGPGGGIVFKAENGQYMECSKDLGEAEWAKALQIARKFKGGRKNDWRPPTWSELSLIYINLFKNGYGSFLEEEYWSSSESNNEGREDRYYPVCLDFMDGWSYRRDRDDSSRVLAVRSFQ